MTGIIDFRGRSEEFMATFRLASDSNASSEDLSEIKETFWVLLCLYVGYVMNYAEYASQSVLGEMEESLIEEEDQYRMFVQNQVADYATCDDPNPIIRRMMRERNERLEEGALLFEQVFG